MLSGGANEFPHKVYATVRGISRNCTSHQDMCHFVTIDIPPDIFVAKPRPKVPSDVIERWEFTWVLMKHKLFR